MSSINDWVAKAAQQILTEAYQGQIKNEERIAIIITVHAEPLIALLREARREHDIEEDESCPKRWNEDVLCTCGADAWNARIDKVLNS